MTPDPRRARSTLLAGAATFTLVTALVLYLRFRLAPAFGAMFADFGGDGALPRWTVAWTFGWSPYAVVEVLALAVLGFAARAHWRRDGRWLGATVAFGVVLWLATLGAALLAFYAPIFAIAGTIEAS